MKLSRKVAIITGGSRGIGAGISAAFVREGAEVVLVGRNLQDLQERQQILSSGGGKAHVCCADVSVESDVKRAAEEAQRLCGRVDVLVNAAGISMVRPTTGLSLEDWNACLNINLTGTFLMCREVGAMMMASGKGGKMINIASIVAHAAFPKRAAYASSKGGIVQLTQALAVEWAPFRIQVNSISPGIIRTELVDELIRSGMHDTDKLTGRVPMGRLGEVSDVAGPAVFLASSDSDYMTGSDLVVDGGWLANGYV